MEKNKITKQSENFSEWYLDVVREAGLAENGEVRGCGIIKPYGFKIWELIKKFMSEEIEATGVENVYFPVLVPMENFAKEASHVEGFSPELAVVTHGGGEELENPLAIRPTSEAAMYSAYARWIQSYRDLPMRFNQWNNVLRWEKRPRPFLRWSEFLWQEGHTVFETEKDARAEMWQMLDVYAKVAEKFLCLPVLKGRKSEMEKFAGAVTTTTIEAMAKDGKSIQSGTSHYLGQNFAKVFGVKFLDREGREQFAHQNSWGSSWRLVGAVIMAHGDDHGLRLPSPIAPVQIVILPISKDSSKNLIENFLQSSEIETRLKNQNYRIKIDTRDLTPGFKFNEWELKGVPIRIEIGQKEVETNSFTIFRRDTMTRETFSIENLEKEIDRILQEHDENLFNDAKKFRDEHTFRVENFSDFEIGVRKDIAGYFDVSWCESLECEKQIKEKTSAVSRVLPIENEEKNPKNEKCFHCGNASKHDWIFARSY
ncbi:MAG: proline--tRNA ligase [Patescibacteria group bacterium]